MRTDSYPFVLSSATRLALAILPATARALSNLSYSGRKLAHTPPVRSNVSVLTFSKSALSSFQL